MGFILVVEYEEQSLFRMLFQIWVAYLNGSKDVKLEAGDSGEGDEQEARVLEGDAVGEVVRAAGHAPHELADL